MLKSIALLIILAGACLSSDLGRYAQAGFDIRVQSGVKSSLDSTPGWPETPVIAMAVSCDDPDVIEAVVNIQVEIRDPRSRRGWSEANYSRRITIADGNAVAVEIETPGVARAITAMSVTPGRRSNIVVLKAAANL